MSTSAYPHLCESFRDLAAWTFSKLGKANRLGMAYNEETVTENLLLILAERHAGRDLKIRSYTKHEEGRGTKKTGSKPTGADWSFWFADVHHRGIELRIQAKRLFMSGAYDHLDGSGKQINDLKKNCGSAIPLYVFYNGTCGVLIKHLIENLCCPLGFLRETDWGCTYAPLTGIPKQDKPKPSDISHMRPWHTLVCKCHCYGVGFVGSTGSLPQRVAASVKNSYDNAAEKEGRQQGWTEQLSFSSENEAPDWVRILQELDAKAQLADGQDDRQPSEMDAYLNDHGLRGVAFIEEREV
jgi:hypothetical protein